jgi:hypothetical protein
MEHLTDENIINYLDGKVAYPERFKMLAHFVICPACLETKTQFQELERMLWEIGRQIRLESQSDPSRPIPPAS